MNIDKLTSQTLPLKQSNSIDVQNNQLTKTSDVKELKEKNVVEIKDIYTSNKENSKEPTGLYKLVEKDGVKKIEYDKIDKVNKTEEKAKTDNKEKTEKANVYHVNTDKVDREIEKIKNKKKELINQISRLSASDDIERTQKLKAELARIESELSMKDNDAYRKANSKEY